MGSVARFTAILGLIQHTIVHLFQYIEKLAKGNVCRIAFRFLAIDQDHVEDLGAHTGRRQSRHRITSADEGLEFYRLCQPSSYYDRTHTAFSIFIENETPAGNQYRAELLFLDVHGR